MAAREIEHDVERRMGATATGILLDGDAGLDDVERCTPVREDAHGVVGSPPVEYFQKTLIVLKLAGIGGEIPLGKQRCKEAVASAMTHMQRLRHRTEVRLDAGGERGSDGERGGPERCVEPQEMRRRCGGPVDAERRGRVPTLCEWWKLTPSASLHSVSKPATYAVMKARPSTGRSSASAKRAGRIGADGCPPKVLLQSSKSSACAAVPLISAASSTLERSAEPNTRLAPAAGGMTRPRIRTDGSTLPATATPTVSRMPTLAQCTACGGKSSNRNAAHRRESSYASCMLHLWRWRVDRIPSTRTHRGFRQPDRSYSALMPVVRITLPHRSVSSAMSLPKSAGEPGMALASSASSRALMVESASTALTSRLRLWTISADVFLGAPRPDQ